jgi:hypothetical protein
MARWNISHECYGLNMKYLPQAHVLKDLSSDDTAILGGDGNIREWSIVRGSG